MPWPCLPPTVRIPHVQRGPEPTRMKLWIFYIFFFCVRQALIFGCPKCKCVMITIRRNFKGDIITEEMSMCDRWGQIKGERGWGWGIRI